MNAVNVLLSPPITLLIFLVLGLVLSKAANGLAAKGAYSQGKEDSYACGQKDIVHNVSPDYSQFFPYAFFFTIMHVLVLIVATAPLGAIVLPLAYVLAGVLALLIIFRR